MELIKDQWVTFDSKGKYVNTFAIVAKGYEQRKFKWDWFQPKIADTEHYQIWELCLDAKESTEYVAKSQFGKYFIGLITFNTKTLRA